MDSCAGVTLTGGSFCCTEFLVMQILDPTRVCWKLHFGYDWCTFGGRINDSVCHFLNESMDGTRFCQAGGRVAALVIRDLIEIEFAAQLFDY